MSEKLKGDQKPTTGLLERVPGLTRAWRWFMGDQPAETPASATILCERKPGDPTSEFGRIEYGAEPGNDGSASAFDTWIFHENGGPVMILFVIDASRRLYVGVVEQYRWCEWHPVYNPTAQIENVPRGYVDVGATMSQAAKKKTRGEVGVFESGETIRLPGNPLNANNAWISYKDELDGDGNSVRQGGVIPFAVQLKADHLEPVDNEHFRIKPDKLGERSKGSPYEMIGNCQFTHWTDVTRKRDGFACAGIARLLAYLTEQRIEFR